MIKLTPTEKASLEAQLKKERNACDWKRLAVILGFDDGKTVDELEEIFRISPYTVENYLKEYTYNNKSHNDPRGGSKSKLNEEQTRELNDHLSKVTYLKVKNIVFYVLNKYGILYSRTGMTNWLEENGFTFKRPKTVPGKVNPSAQEAFVEEYEKLKEKLTSDEEIFFIDGTHPEYQSQPVCGWIKKGEEKTLQTTGKQFRLHVVGAVNLCGMKILTKEYGTIDADAMIDFFKLLETQSTAKVIHVICDNARANKCRKIEEYLKTSRIIIHYLPPYSPNLNPIERLWKLMRESKIYNRYYSTFKDFFTAIRSFFDSEIYEMGEILKKLITDNFQVIELNPVVLG